MNDNTLQADTATQANQHSYSHDENTEELKRYLLHFAKAMFPGNTVSMTDRRRLTILRIRIKRLTELFKLMNRFWDEEMVQMQREISYYFMCNPVSKPQRSKLIENTANRTALLNAITNNRLTIDKLTQHYTWLDKSISGILDGHPERTE